MSDNSNTQLPPATAPVQTEGTALGVVSIILGAGGTVPVVGILFAILGIVVGKMAKDRGTRTGNSVGATLGIIGMVVSAITLVIAAFMLFLMGGLVSTLFGVSHALGPQGFM